MAPAKVTREVTVTFPAMAGPWAPLGGLRVDGYEIRNGQVSADGCEVTPHVWVRGSVLATTVHGLLEHPDVLQRLCGLRPTEVLQPTFDVLADAVDEHLDTDLLWRTVES